jgi:hypothetical protein
VEANDATASVALTDVTKRHWQLELCPDRLQLVQTGSSESLNVARQDVRAKIGLHTSLTSRIMMTVRGGDGGKRALFFVSEDALAKIAQWLGVNRAAALLTRPFSWVAILVGIVWLLASIPLAGAPEEGIEATPFDTFRCLVGLASLVVGIAGRIRAHRSVVLLYALWCLAVASDNARSVLADDSSPAWLIPSALLVTIGFGHFRFYRVLGRAGAL